MEESRPRKDKSCVRCIHIFSCPGKPENVTLCLNYKERGGGYGRKTDVHAEDNRQ